MTMSRGDAQAEMFAGKEAAGLMWHYLIDASTVDAFFTDRVICHPAFPQSLSLGQLYSLLKFADRFAVSFFANEIAEHLRALLGAKFSGKKDEWGIVSDGYLSVSSAARSLAERVSLLLDLPFAVMMRTDIPAANYAGMPDFQSRLNSCEASRHEFTVAPRPRIIFIDDCAISGAAILNMTRRLRAIRQEVHPYVLVNSLLEDLTVEDKLNSAMVSEENPDYLIHLFQEGQAPFTVRALKVLLGTSVVKRRQIVALLSREQLKDAIRVAKESGLSAGDRYEAGLRDLIEAHQS